MKHLLKVKHLTAQGSAAAIWKPPAPHSIYQTRKVTFAIQVSSNAVNVAQMLMNFFRKSKENWAPQLVQER